MTLTRLYMLSEAVDLSDPDDQKSLEKLLKAVASGKVPDELSAWAKKKSGSARATTKKKEPDVMSLAPDKRPDKKPAAEFDLPAPKSAVKKIAPDEPGDEDPFANLDLGPHSSVRPKGKSPDMFGGMGAKKDEPKPVNMPNMLPAPKSANFQVPSAGDDYKSPFHPSLTAGGDEPLIPSHRPGGGYQSLEREPEKKPSFLSKMFGGKKTAADTDQRKFARSVARREREPEFDPTDPNPNVRLKKRF